MSSRQSGSPAPQFAVAVALAATALVGLSNPAAAAPFESLSAPQRLVDGRASGETIDGEDEGFGTLAPDDVIEIQVAGRGDVPIEAEGAVLNVTAVNAASDGFFTVFPCNDDVPNTSNLNYRAGQNIANTVFASLDDDGFTCVATSAQSNLIVDVTGTLPGDAFRALPEPRRLADTRPGADTFDNRVRATGPVSGGTAVEIPVRGRAGVPYDATTAVLNVTTAGAEADGFFTVYPCGAVPTASNLNYVRGQVVANAVVAELSVDGDVCVFTSARSNVIVDVAGTLASDEFGALPEPRRFVDTRPGGRTIDAQDQNTDVRPGRSTLSLKVAGRGGIPQNAGAVILNVTAVSPTESGYVTVHPRGSQLPNASNLNYGNGRNVANLVVAGIGDEGSVCLFTSGRTDLVVDVAGYLNGPPPTTSDTTCPTVTTPPPPPPAGTFLPGQYEVGKQIPAGRYVMENARSGCYWVRTSGFGGAFDELLGFDYRAGSGRAIVDVLAGDVGFEFAGPCGWMAPFRGVVGACDHDPLRKPRRRATHRGRDVCDERRGRLFLATPCELRRIA